MNTETTENYCTTITLTTKLQ